MGTICVAVWSPYSGPTGRDLTRDSKVFGGLRGIIALGLIARSHARLGGIVGIYVIIKESGRGSPNIPGRLQAYGG